MTEGWNQTIDSNQKSECPFLAYLFSKSLKKAFFSSLHTFTHNAGKTPAEPHGMAPHVHIQQTENDKQRWQAISWQYCPMCGMMLPD